MMPPGKGMVLNTVEVDTNILLELIFSFCIYCWQWQVLESNALNVYPHALNAAIPYKRQSRSLATFFINLANL